MPPARSSPRALGCWTVPAGPIEVPACLTRSSKSICEVRRHTGCGPGLVAGRTAHPHSTVWKVLHRHGLSERKRSPREAARCYEWSCPGWPDRLDSVRLIWWTHEWVRSDPLDLSIPRSPS
jgi:hypothetical protein